MKVLVIGLDGATFDIIKPLMSKGKLPTLSKLLENGVCGVCKSTHPPVTSPAWPSFMTGCNRNVQSSRIFRRSCFLK